VTVQLVSDRFFAGQLAGAVDADRARVGVFVVGLGLAAVKDTVGTDVQQPDAVLPAPMGDSPGALGVDGEGVVAVGFAAVHVGVSGRQNDAVRIGVV